MTVDLAPLTLRTVAAGVGIDGVTLVATPVDATGCDAAELTLTLGATSGGGYLNTSLPAGCVPVDGVSSCPEVTGTLVVVDEEGETPDPFAVVTLADMEVVLP